MKINFLKTKILKLTATGSAFLVGLLSTNKVFGAPLIPSGSDVPISHIGDVVSRFELVVTWVQYIFFAVATLFIIMAAFAYLTSAGDETKITAAKNRLLYAIVAIAIALLGYAIIRIVHNFMSTGL